MVRDVFIHRLANTNIVTMKHAANGAVLGLMARVAYIHPLASIATAPAATSASGADRHPTAPAAITAPQASTRSEREWKNKVVSERRLSQEYGL
jgi:hypothetical protein